MRNMQSNVFWEETPCSAVEACQYLKGKLGGLLPDYTASHLNSHHCDNLKSYNVKYILDMCDSPIFEIQLRKKKNTDSI
jgi:hypothetical protein